MCALFNPNRPVVLCTLCCHGDVNTCCHGDAVRSVRGVKYQLGGVRTCVRIMSWLSGGLSQFSSLTDQISSFTKDVITETTEEIEGSLLRVCIKLYVSRCLFLNNAQYSRASCSYVPWICAK